MKKTGILCIVAMLMAMTGVFAQVAENEAKPEQTSQESEEMKALQAAYTLAEYGYATESASALIEAAEILSQVETQPLKGKNTKAGESAQPEQSTGHEYTASKLIEDGIQLAGKDKTLLAWAQKVKKGIRPATRGATRGPQYDMDCARGNGGSFRYTIYFDGGRYASVSVRSLDGCDYDLYVYDENGNLIDQDVSYSPSAYVGFTPRWTGPFSIVVKNRSRYAGRYSLTTN